MRGNLLQIGEPREVEAAFVREIEHCREQRLPIVHRVKFHFGCYRQHAATDDTAGAAQNGVLRPLRVER